VCQLKTLVTQRQGSVFQNHLEVEVWQVLRVFVIALYQDYVTVQPCQYLLDFLTLLTRLEGKVAQMPHGIVRRDNGIPTLYDILVHM
jgi:hypothetical protein